MAHTYTKIHIHAIFAVTRREALIQASWKDELHKYITGIIQMHGHKILAINGMPDHVHILFGMRPTQSLSDLMQDVKGASSKWVNQYKRLPIKFEWQQGYGAFSYSKSQLLKVMRYIEDQDKHHKKMTFQEEYKCYLEKLGIDYDDRYVFKDLQ